MARRALLALTLLIAALAAAPAAYGAEIAVTTTIDTPFPGIDDGLCSLREAVLAARFDVAVQGCPAGGGPALDTVRLPAGAFALTQAGPNEEGGATGDLDIQQSIRVAGAGTGATVVAVTSGDRAFDVLPLASLALEDLTIRGAHLPGETGANAGGLRNQATLTLTRVLMDDNAAAQGDSAGDDAGGSGGAIWSGNRAEATVTVVDSTFTNNRAGRGAFGDGRGGDGGAIRIAAGTLTVSGSTFAGNAAGLGSNTSGQLGSPGGNGGAIAVGPGSATVTNSTFASNTGGEGGEGRIGRDTTGGNGGAIWVSGGSGLVASSTFLGNARGLASNGANGITSSFVGGSILADPEPRCGGVVATALNLLSSPDASCPAPVLVGDPRLGLLAANGGPTATLLPGPGSAAVNALAGAPCPATDQRGLPRPALGACDAGAVEVQPGEPGGVATVPRRGVTGLAARRVSSLTVSPAVFRAAPSGASVGKAAKALQAKAPIGATVRYRLDGAARVTFTITKPVPGRRKGRRCVKPAAAKPGAKRCIRTQKLKGSFAHQGVAGQNAFRFTGRLRGKALALGRYTLVARLPRPATGRSALATKAFRIVR